MNKLMTLAVVLGMTAAANAHEPIYVPQSTTLAYQAAEYAPTPANPVPAAPVIQPVPAHQSIAPGTVVCNSCDNPGIELYCNVKVHRTRKMAPCSVPKIVAVPNPCYDPCDVCCPQPKCVFVQICVPPCACEEVCCIRNGRGTLFSYGGTAVRVLARGDRLVVTYLS